MKPTSLEDLYAKFAPVAGEAPPDTQRELGQFDVFSLGDLRPGRHHRPPTPFNRQAFYKISLSHGEGRVEFADHAVEVGPDTLFLTTPRTAYRWTVHGEALTGYFCIFTEEFLLPAKERNAGGGAARFSAGGVAGHSGIRGGMRRRGGHF